METFVTLGSCLDNAIDLSSRCTLSLALNIPSQIDWSAVNIATKNNEELKELSNTYSNMSLVEASTAERHDTCI